MTHRQRVVIENNHGEKLVGILHDTGSKELAILCHGFQSWKVFNCDILNLIPLHFKILLIVMLVCSHSMLFCSYEN